MEPFAGIPVVEGRASLRSKSKGYSTYEKLEAEALNTP